MSGFHLNHNFAKSGLASGITDAATTLPLLPGDGAKFPAVGNYLCVVWDSAYASPVSDLTREIIEVTARSTDDLTIVRAREGTTAKAWNVDDHIGLVITGGKIDELEVGIGQAGNNLLQNASFAQWDGTTGAPAGWTMAGAGAAVTMANGSYGYRKMTLTAGGGAGATLTQTLSSDVPKISGHYGIAAFALVSAGGTGAITFDTCVIAVTNTTVALKQVSNTVTAWGFVISIDAGKAITVELPTVMLGRALPYPMYGPKDAIGHQQLGHPQRGSYRGTIANGATITINIAGLAQASVDVMLGLTCYWHSTTVTGSGGLLKATQYRTSGGGFMGPTFFTEGALSTLHATATVAGYVTIHGSATGNIITITNSLAGGAEVIRVVVDYLWG